MIVSIISLVVAVAALTSSLYIYIKHDKELKDQAKLINSYQIERNKKEEEESKKAIIEANAKDEGKGVRTIFIYNKGKCLAKNVQVELPENDSMYFLDQFPSMTDIRPQNSITGQIQLLVGHPNSLEIIFKWDDEYKTDNEDHQTIQL